MPQSPKPAPLTTWIHITCAALGISALTTFTANQSLQLVRATQAPAVKKVQDHEARNTCYVLGTQLSCLPDYNFVGEDPHEPVLEHSMPNAAPKPQPFTRIPAPFTDSMG